MKTARSRSPKLNRTPDALQRNGNKPMMRHLAALVLLLLGACWAPGAARAAAPRRVISMSPNLTESLLAIGAGDLLVGVSDFCQLPAPYRALPRCGSWSSPNLEVLRSLQPDLILVLGKNQKIRDLAGRGQGIPVESFAMDNAATIQSEILRLGRLLGREAGATSLTRAMSAELAALKTELDRHPPASRPLVLFSLGRQPGSIASIMVPTAGSFLDEALTLAGGRNSFADVRGVYPSVAKENLLLRRPEVIIELTGGVELTAAQKQAMIDDWKALPSLPAVQQRRIYVLTQDFLMMPGPRQPRIVRILHDVLYPAPAAATTGSLTVH